MIIKENVNMKVRKVFYKVTVYDIKKLKIFKVKQKNFI